MTEQEQLTSALDRINLSYKQSVFQTIYRRPDGTLYSDEDNHAITLDDGTQFEFNSDGKFTGLARREDVYSD